LPPIATRHEKLAAVDVVRLAQNLALAVC
jgi:hypothetical protein